MFDNTDDDVIPDPNTFSIGSLSSDEEIYDDDEIGGTRIPMHVMPSLNERIENVQPETTTEESETTPGKHGDPA